MLLTVLLIKFVTVALLVWAFHKPEQLLYRSRRWWAMLALSAMSFLLAVPPLSGQTKAMSELFIGWPLLWAVIFRGWLRRILQPMTPAWLMAMTIFILLFVQEVFVVLDYGGPVVAHFVHYTGFYVGIVLTVLLCYRRWRYSVLQTFLVGGLWGVAVEQEFKTAKLLASGNVVEALAFVVWIFPVYGLYLAAPRLLFCEECEQSAGLFSRPVVLFVLIVTMPLALWLLWAGLLGWLGFAPGGVQ